MKNYSDIVDFPVIIKSKSPLLDLSSENNQNCSEFVVLGVKSLSYVEACCKQTTYDNDGSSDFLFSDCSESGDKFHIPVTYGTQVTVECKKPKGHVYQTAQDLVIDFPRYVTVNAYFSLHHRGVSVKSGDDLELMRMEKRCENLRGPVSFLICRYEHREIALPMETRGNFTVQEDPNLYTVTEVINRFPLPQIIRFQSENLITDDSARNVIDHMNNFSGEFVLQRHFSEDYLVGCPITSSLDCNDTNSDDSGIICSCPAIGKKFIFINGRSDQVFHLNESILCDMHDSVLNSGRRIFVDNMQDSIMRLAVGMTPEKPLYFTVDQLMPARPTMSYPRSRSCNDQLTLNIPAVKRSSQGGSIIHKVISLPLVHKTAGHVILTVNELATPCILFESSPG